jgi:hypothetical protein
MRLTLMRLTLMRLTLMRLTLSSFGFFCQKLQRTRTRCLALRIATEKRGNLRYACIAGDGLCMYVRSALVLMLTHQHMVVRKGGY